MTDTATAVGATIFCVASVVALIGAEWRGDQRARRWAKMAAAAGFLMVAIAAGAPSSEFGRRVLLGLAFGAACSPAATSPTSSRARCWSRRPSG